MSLTKNPFEYEAASKLSKETVLEYFIDSYNYARFVRSKRNVFFIGDRGAGKTMTLLYSSLPVQKIKAERSQENDRVLFDIVCIHIPCNNPLFYKKEYELLPELSASVIGEHFLVLFIVYYLSQSFRESNIHIAPEHENKIKEEFEYITDVELPPGALWDSICMFVDKENRKSQKAINLLDIDYYQDPLTFASIVVPLLHAIKKIPQFYDTHFSLMFDDLQDLNEHQVKCINSWISFRDNSLFSFKIATAKVDRPTKITNSGGTIIEGHDYIEIDMEAEYQNANSNFGQLARDIIRQRLKASDIDFEPDDYFFVSPSFEQKMEKCRQQAKQLAEKKIPADTPNRGKKISDEIYKSARAIFFSQLPAKANVPENAYTGFDQLVHLSTGIVRNLLKPCYLMYDDHVSQKKDPKEPIDPQIQARVIRKESEKMWDNMKFLDTQILGCTSEMCKEICNMFDKIFLHFRNRLEKDGMTDRRAVKFVVSEKSHPQYPHLLKLLNIAQKAQLLFVYTSSGKERGVRETYYVPNRMLLPSRSLDHIGQHAYVSIKVSDLMAAAQSGKDIPFRQNDQPQEKTLFDTIND